MHLIGLTAVCAIAAAAGVAMFTRWARRARLLDVPNSRSSHAVATPRGAGVVIVVVVAITMIGAALTGLFTLAGAALAALAVAIISGIDDVRPLPSGLRLMVHAGCAAVAMLSLTNALGGWPAPWMALGILWIVGLTNAYNFMDGIDGISGVQAVVSGGVAAAAAMHVGLPGMAIAATAIAAASLGFLVHNWPPARVFLGDVGSAFLGFSFAVITLSLAGARPAAGLAVALSLWPYVFDTSLTLLRRSVRRENIFASHRSHLYQRLVIAGCSHARVALTYGALSALCGAAGLASMDGGARWTVAAAPALAALALYSAVLWTETASRRGAAGPGAPVAS